MSVLQAIVAGAEERELEVIEVLEEICVMAIETGWVVTLIEEVIEAGMMVMASMVEAIGFKMIEVIEVVAIMMIEETKMAEGSIAAEEAEDSTDLDLQTTEGQPAVAAGEVVAEADPDQSHKAGTKVATTAIEGHPESTNEGNTMGLAAIAEETPCTRMVGPIQ